MYKRGSVLFEHRYIRYGFNCFHDSCGVSGELVWIAKGPGSCIDVNHWHNGYPLA